MDFYSVLALDGISFDVGAGEIFGFIGPNGAGKTTTIRIIATLQPATSGSVRVDGNCVINAPEEVRKVVGYMPDSYGLYEDITVYEYLDFFAKAFGIYLPDRRRVVEDVMQLTDLAELRGRMVSGLSRGMQQRLCVAKTLVNDPKVLVLDEPAAGLDPRARIEFRELLKELKKMGKTIFISSHILTELSDICTSVGVIEQGRMVVSGPVEEVMRKLRPGKVIRIQFEGDFGNRESILGGLPFIDRWEKRDDYVDVFLKPEGTDVPALVKALVTDDLRVRGVQERSASLEDLFITITEGKVH
jgi:ABC-2 type transport system ATP-binding protein